MIALPSAPTPAPRRQLLVGVGLACAAAAAATGGLLALFLQFRDRAMASEGAWLPEGVKVPMVPANVMLIALLPICVFAQWAVYSAHRGDKPHAGAALGLTGMLGLAVVNAQAMIWKVMAVPAAQGSYSVLFYAVTGLVTLFAIIGVIFSAVTALRFLGGRTADREVVVAHALYWYAFSVVFTMLWFVVYVTK
jgi:heme/copper-type cytochrome/quinol oxidase subunit 3